MTVAGMGFLFVVTTGAFGYDTRIPDVSEIKEVSINTGNTSFKINGKNVLERYTNHKDSIQSVVKVHEKIIDYAKKQKSGGLYAFEQSYDYSEPEDPYYDSINEIKIIYKLKNGKTMTRYYSDYFCWNSDVAKEVIMLSKQKDFSDDDYIITVIPEKYVSSISIGVRDDDVDEVYDGEETYDDCTYSYYLYKYTHEEFKEEKVSKLIAALKKDIQENGIYKETENNLGKFRGYEISIEYENDENNEYSMRDVVCTGMIQIPETYTNTLKALEDTGYGNVAYY